MTDTKQQPSLKLQRLIIELLQTEFLEVEGKYRDGWNDERVAKEAGTAVQVVKLVRREAFGELQEEDPEIALLKAGLADARKLADEYKALVDRALDDLTLKFNSYIHSKRIKK